MSLPIYSSTQNVSTAINICSIVADSPSIRNGQSPGQNAGEMVDLASYYFSAGTTGVGTVLTFQELGADGTWRALVAPAPITLANSTNYNGVVNGPFHGLRVNVSNPVGNGVSYAELKGSIRSM